MLTVPHISLLKSLFDVKLLLSTFLTLYSKLDHLYLCVQHLAKTSLFLNCLTIMSWSMCMRLGVLEERLTIHVTDSHGFFCSTFSWYESGTWLQRKRPSSSGSSKPGTWWRCLCSSRLWDVLRDSCAEMCLLLTLKITLDTGTVFTAHFLHRRTTINYPGW